MRLPHEETTPGTPRRPLTGPQRLMLGGIGGLAPALLNLVVLDANTVFNHATLAACLGYSVRVGALFLLGGFVAWLHESETVRVRLFQLGVAWPAFVMASVNGGAAKGHFGDGAQPGGDKPVAVLEWILPAAAYAQPTQGRIYSFDTPFESALQGFLRGLTGKNDGGRSFVLLRDAFPNRAQAETRATELRANLRVEVRVYDGRGGPSRAGYEVVLGHWMSAEAAVRLEGDLARRGVAARTWAK